MNDQRLNYEPKREMKESVVYAERISDAIKHYSPHAQKILDIGMGQGHLVNRLKKEGIETWGIDLRELGQDNLVVADARAKHFPFKSESFDVVVDCYLLADITDFQEYVIENIYRIINETKRVLKKGGLFITVPSMQPTEFFNEQIFDNGWGFYSK